MSAEKRNPVKNGEIKILTVYKIVDKKNARFKPCSFLIKDLKTSMKHREMIGYILQNIPENVSKKHKLPNFASHNTAVPYGTVKMILATVPA